jgi:hypothetical protein
VDIQTRVVLVAFDGFPLQALGPKLTPNLWSLAQHGGLAPEGGRSGVSSTTYPGFVSLLTGCSRSVSGVRTTARKRDAVPGWAGSDVSEVPTLLHQARDAGVRSAAIFGDHKLERVVHLDEGPGVWPADAELPDDALLDAHGYAVNSVVLPRLLAAAADPDIPLIFCHFNETDTVGHDHGPTASETIDCVRAVDEGVGALVDTLQPDWDRTLVVVASDHDMEPRSTHDPIDPCARPEQSRLISDWISDGSAAFVRLAIGVDHDTAIAALRSIDGIAAWRSYDPDILLLLAAPGRIFAGQKVYAGGTHGSRSTARTLALVGGGHPIAPVLGRLIERRSPRLRDWAPTIAGILSFDLPAADGTDLLTAGYRDQ